MWFFTRKYRPTIRLTLPYFSEQGIPEALLRCRVARRRSTCYSDSSRAKTDWRASERKAANAADPHPCRPLFTARFADDRPKTFNINCCIPEDNKSSKDYKGRKVAYLTRVRFSLCRFLHVGRGGRCRSVFLQTVAWNSSPKRLLARPKFVRRLPLWPSNPQPVPNEFRVTIVESIRRCIG